jgi:hypothetical protein
MIVARPELRWSLRRPSKVHEANYITTLGREFFAEAQ